MPAELLPSGSEGKVDASGLSLPSSPGSLYDVEPARSDGRPKKRPAASKGPGPVLKRPAAAERPAAENEPAAEAGNAAPATEILTVRGSLTAHVYPGLVLGCPKCRNSRVGCATCRRALTH